LSANPVNHVLDIPYFGITKDWALTVPAVVDGKIPQEWWDSLLGSGGTFGPVKMVPAVITVHTLSALLVMFLLLWGGFSAVRGVRKRPDQGRGIASQLFEVLIKFIRDDVAKPNLGPHGARYFPLVLTFFFFILFSNLWGMVPTGGLTQAPTGNPNVTLMLASVVFFGMFVFGIREQGLVKFVKNLVPAGLPVAMLPIMYPIELLGPITKGVALCIRLFANMIAGHIILAAFGGLAMDHGHLGSAPSVFGAYMMSVGVSCLEVFVAFLQAYVFTMLASVFLGSFIHPDH
jgi:F-type H+-transporting ATPase subunit a